MLARVSQREAEKNNDRWIRAARERDEVSDNQNGGSQETKLNEDALKVGKLRTPAMKVPGLLGLISGASRACLFAFCIGFFSSWICS